MNVSHPNKYSDEFYSLIEELKELLNTTVINRIGLFEWISKKKSNGRIKTTYRITNNTLISQMDVKSSLGWYLNYSDNRLELISVFNLRIGAMGLGGDVLLYKFKKCSSFPEKAFRKTRRFCFDFLAT